jgi:type IV pilus assembly protein PilW
VLTNKRADTDILVARHAETCVAGVGNCEADTAGKLYFLAGMCDAQTYELKDSGFTMQRRDCATAAEKRKFISNMYYIRDYAVTAGDGIPTLMRSSFDLSGGVLGHQSADALVEGIEAMRVEFGVDGLSETGAAVDYTAAVNWQDPSAKTTPTNRGDGAADGAFVRCTTAVPCSTAQLTNAVAVKIYLLARSREPTPGHVDGKTYNMGLANAAYDPCTGLSGSGLTTCRSYKRHLFTTTVRLNNVSGRRDTP